MSKVILSFLFIFLFQGAGYADEGDRRSENFETKKTRVLENIGKKRSAMNTFESCVKSANSREEFKACRKAHRATMEKLHPKGKRDKKRGKKRGRGSDED
jgi:hypothetical protein